MDDLTGRKFGRWNVLKATEKKGKHQLYLCKCECGKTKNVYGCHLKAGNSKSCGCIVSEITTKRNLTHGMTYTPEFMIWQGMQRRCSDKSNVGYCARGIYVCDRWKSFENFFADMGSRPSSKHTIERKDNNDGYFKDNCKWATKTEQARNRRAQSRKAIDDVGIYLNSNGRYRAIITTAGVDTHLGYFGDIEDARTAREEAKQKYWR